MKLSLYILAIWLFNFLTFCGVGLLFYRAWHVKIKKMEDIFLSFWIGFAVTLAFLLIWHFFAPISSTLSLAITSVGLLSFVLSYNQWHSILHQSIFKNFIYWLLALVLALATSLFIGLPHVPNDSGLYHYTSIQWLLDYPHVVGLANLHERLALNNATFFYQAFVDAHPWTAHRSYYLSTGLPVLVLLFHLVTYLKSTITKFFSAKASFYFALLMIGPLINLILNSSLDSTSTDIPVILFSILIITLLIHRFEDPPATQKETLFSFTAIALLICTGITIKLSFLFLGLPLACIHGVLLAKGDLGKGRTLILKGLLIYGVVGSIVLLPWLIRGIGLSGYPFFPSPTFAFPVDWRLPIESVDQYRIGVYAFNRLPVLPHIEYEGNWQWLKPWFSNMLHSRDFLLPTSLIMLGTLSFMTLISRSYQTILSNKMLLFLTPALFSVGAWFFTAPSIRFGSIYLWTLGGLLCAISFSLFSKPSFFKRSGVVVACFIAAHSWWPIDGEINFIKTLVAEKNIVRAFGALEFQSFDWTRLRLNTRQLESPPKPFLKRFRTKSGLEIWTPDLPNDLCWNAQLLCTPKPKKEFTLRDGKTIRHGFRFVPIKTLQTKQTHV